ncbi:hypothetical protein Tco_1196992, partial [Tanacetum coccineum]
TLNNTRASRLINENNVEALFGVTFTSQNDIDVFSKSIEDGKSVDIMSTLSSEEIDAVVNAIECIGKKFPIVEPSRDDHIVCEVNINTKKNSYAVASKDQPKVTSNFRPLVAD